MFSLCVLKNNIPRKKEKIYTLCQLPKGPENLYALILPRDQRVLYKREIQAQRGQENCTKSHSLVREKQGSEPKRAQPRACLSLGPFHQGVIGS